MKKKIFSIIQYSIFLGIGIFLIWWQFSKMTPLEKTEFSESLRHTRYIYIIPVFAIAILSHISRAMRWKLLIEPMGYRPSTYNTFYATMCGYFANTFVPRAGEILRCTLLGKYEKIPVPKLIGTIILERVFDLLCYFLLVVFTFLIQIKLLTQFISSRLDQIVGSEPIVPAWAKLLIGLLAALIGYWFITRVFKKHANHSFIIKIQRLKTELKEGFATIIHLKKRKEFLFHTVFIWSMYLLQIYVGFFALSATTGLGISAALSVLSLATIAMIVSPGGIGAFPVAIQQVLLVYDVDNISFGWLMWGISTGIVIVVGLLCFGLIIYNNKKNNETQQSYQG